MDAARELHAPTTWVSENHKERARWRTALVSKTRSERERAARACGRGRDVLGLTRNLYGAGDTRVVAGQSRALFFSLYFLQNEQDVRQRVLDFQARACGGLCGAMAPRRAHAQGAAARPLHVARAAAAARWRRPAAVAPAHRHCRGPAPPARRLRAARFADGAPTTEALPARFRSAAPRVLQRVGAVPALPHAAVVARGLSPVGAHARCSPMTSATAASAAPGAQQPEPPAATYLQRQAERP